MAEIMLSLNPNARWNFERGRGLVIVLVDMLSVFLAHSSIFSGDAILRMPSETSQVDSLRNVGDNLDTGRTTSNSRSFAGEVTALGPFARMVHLAFVRVDTFDIWIILL